MDKQTIFIIFGAWIALNVIFPLILNSIERLYQNRIDVLVKRCFNVIVIIIMGATQVCLIVFLAPTIFLIAIIERIWPAFFEIKCVRDTGIYLDIHRILKKNFWPEVKEAFNSKKK
jgi:hypothetical protein